ncbi:MAG: TIGR02147 family protein [Bdellovibrionales bacterium]|jgi:uncharacterized protein (TIGR02147 family)|nr:TIGR02147 family protein [Bdellovibrionales bacterium]
MTTVFNFTDYREFLKSYYQEQKQLNKSFSYGVLAKNAKISSRGLLKLIIDGKRNLSLSNISGITTGLDLNKSESEYFLTMVQLNQAKENEDKHKYYEKLMNFPQKRRSSDLKREQYNLYSKWYFSVLLELVLLQKKSQSIEDFFLWVSRSMKGKLTLKEVKGTYQQLIALGLIKEVDGQLRQAQNFLESNAKEEVNFAIQNFHREMLTQATAALEQPIEKRAFGGVTLALRRSDLPRMKEFIREFRNKFNLEFSANSGADSVYQLNVQFFELVDGEKASTDPILDLNSTIEKQIVENSFTSDREII